MKIVLQKFIADSGYCSRRKAEDLIRNGEVRVNGKVAALGGRVDDGDEVLVEGKIIKTESEKYYIVLNKPVGYTCTNRKFKDEKNVFDLVDVKERLHVVGRLDKNSRGLVLLTNDGDLTQKLTHPSFEHEKEYIVKIKNQKLKIKDILENLNSGVDIGERDGVILAKDVKYLGHEKFMIVLTEGKKRQIRRMFEAVGCEVLDLVRVRIGGIKLGNLKEGEWKHVKPHNFKTL